MTTCNAGWCGGLVDVSEGNPEWLRWFEVCGELATMQLRTACLHEHCRTWPVCGDCAEALALRLRSRPAQCPLCLVLAAEGHKGCPVTVLIRPLGLVRP